MSITLCFDFGNTRLKCAIFIDDKFSQEILLDDDDESTIQSIIDQYKPEKSILSSVINHNPAIENLLQHATHFNKLNHHSKVPVTTPVGKPDTIGADRLALVVAAVTIFPRNNN